MTSTENSVDSPTKPHRGPTTGSFVILLVTLWALNLADIFQTLYLQASGMLAQEANYVMGFFLHGGPLRFLLAKVFALILITSILSRGWSDRRGIKMGGAHYSLSQVRASIYLLLAAGVVYFTLIVVLPFIVLVLSGLFTVPEQPSL
jgi:hypothetical protein